MDTPDDATQDRTRAGMDQEREEPTPGTDARSSTHGREAPVPLLAALLDLIARLITAQLPGMVEGVEARVRAALHPQGGAGSPDLTHRVRETGDRVVDWSRRHPAQAIVAGALVVTAAVVIGCALRADDAHPRAQGTRKRRRSTARPSRGNADAT